jgi:thiol-disulfide isomerase/thioredoxin
MRTLTTFAAFVALGVSALAAPPVPRPAKELDVAEPNGTHHLLSSYKGKVVVVQCLFTTCPHCQAFSHDVLTKMQTDYGPRGFQALGLAFNEPAGAAPGTAPDAGMVKSYAMQFAPNFPVGPAARDTAFSFLGFSVMERIVVPQLAVIDRKGMIVAETEGNPDTAPKLQQEAYLRGLVESLLGGGASSSNQKPAAPATPAGGAKKADTKKPLS